jgi:beta-mannosidase
VWQDFMFANMDYPVGDATFRAEVEAEAREQLARLRRHACIAAYCGGSEVAQQAAMLGLAKAHWTNDFFARSLPALCESEHPGIPYFPSSPWGGALPFHTGAGLTHYYGVGAYRRPLADVKSARVKFTPECLGFSNVPEPSTAALLGDGTVPAPHDPRWKSRVPRDSGAGYDFEDVRDHYFAVLTGKDPVVMRSSDPARYLALSRIVTGEVMGRVFSEWRRPGSECGGALVWFYRDLWPGAGWGITDSHGVPKAAYWYLRRAWQPVTVRLTDEGLDGVALHVVNDSAERLEGEVELELLQQGRLAAAPAKAAVSVAARDAITLQGDALLGYFSDAAHAYRFGPPKFDVIVARLRIGGHVMAEDFLFPVGIDSLVRASAALDARIKTDGEDPVLSLRSDCFLQAVRIEAEGYEPDDNYFHLSPTQTREIRFQRRDGARHLEVRIEALNLAGVHEAR